MLKRFEIDTLKQQDTPYITGPKLEGVPCL